jgi:hypothetical protein
MQYDIYFHNDFDGRASAAVMLDFLRKRGDDIEHYTAVDFDMQAEYLKDDFFAAHRFFRGKRNPAIVVDFSFHSKAAFWFDHHPTAFKRDDWKKKFRQSKFHQWHPEYLSCCHEVMDRLKEDFSYRPPAHIRELAKWLDVVDGARYDSAKQTIEKKEPALQLNAYVENDLHGAKDDERFIRTLSEHPMAAIIKDPAIKKSIQNDKRATKTGLNYYKKNLKIYGAVAGIILPSSEFGSLRFAPYYLHPKLLYFGRITKKNKFFTLSFGVNPWRRKENDVHIGEFLKTHFPGAGGHHDVGGAEFKTKKDAERAMEEIVRIFK